MATSLLLSFALLSAFLSFSRCDEQPATDDVRVFKGKPQLSLSLAKDILELYQSSSSSRSAGEPFTVAISGGSLPKLLAAGLEKEGTAGDLPAGYFADLHVFYADERLVPLDHPDSNHAACLATLFGPSRPLAEATLHPIDPTLPPAEAARAYEAELAQVFGVTTGRRSVPPRFDLILLGMGPDGHTASLFPGHALLREASRWVAFIGDSPKPPPQRLTLTLPVLNAAHHVRFVCTGAGKSANLAKVLPSPPRPGSVAERSGDAGEEGHLPLPAALVNPEHGTLAWFVDEAAAELWSASQQLNVADEL